VVDICVKNVITGIMATFIETIFGTAVNLKGISN
jgi:hypothetical protein